MARKRLAVPFVSPDHAVNVLSGLAKEHPRILKTPQSREAPRPVSHDVCQMSSLSGTSLATCMRTG